MERVSSKTQDCYVEFLTLQDATRAVERHQTNIQKGRLSRLGDRPVDVQLSSQSALMRDLFPLASGVFWDGPRPVIQDPIEGQPWKTFKGFVTEEEMAMLVKHVEMPHRVSCAGPHLFCLEGAATLLTAPICNSRPTPRNALSARTSA